MSSILKALKKLEAEKARTPGRQIDLARDILSPGEPRRSNPLQLALLVLSLVLLGGLLGMAMFSWFTLGESPLISSGSAPVEAWSIPLAARQMDAAELPRVADPPAAVATPAPADPPPTVANPHRPRLVVSGIVYQQNPENRMAVVNDLPIMVGTSIEGALVEEIRPASVVFSLQGERFEIMFRE